MPKPIDISGVKFGRLTAKFKLGKDRFGIALWSCLCDCGEVPVVRLSSLRSGATASCGCWNREVRQKRWEGNELAISHGLSKHILYPAWREMKQRCTNPNRPKYKHYGARGISVCERWAKSFPNFLKDMGERPDGYSLNRIDNDGDYCKENCEWQTYSEQNRNRRSYTRHDSTGLFNEL